MIRLLHLSDLHFGPPFRPEVGEAVQRSAVELEPDLLVISGDFTQRAKPEQFAAARDFLDRLPDVPRIEIPGNHDVPLYRFWERLVAPYRNYQASISEERDRVLEIDGAVLVALDTTSAHRTITRGKIERPQIEFCRTAMEKAPEGAVRIVVVHHQFAPAPDRLRDLSILGAEWAMAELHEIGIDMVLGGHLHRAYFGSSLDYYPGPSDRGILLVQSGTSTSSRGRGRERGRNSFNLIEIHDHQLEVTQYLYSDESDGFGVTGFHRFPRRRWEPR